MLSELLKEKDLHASQLARRVGVNRSTASKWARGFMKPKECHITQIATALNVSVDDVIKCFEEATEKENV